MSTKQEVADQLTALGVPFDPSATKATLDALLAGHQDPAKAAADAKATADANAAKASAEQTEVEVGDPLILRPIDLPLVVKPAGGSSWKNDEQAKFAAPWRDGPENVPTALPSGNSPSEDSAS